MTARAVLAAGSNIGDRAATLERGLRLLAVHPQVTVVAISPVYETDPVGGPVQDDFLNLVALIDTDVAARSLLGLLQVIEAACGRERVQRWGPRTLDLDLITYDALVSADPGLMLPHPRAHERAFVLQPWADLEPGAELPGHGSISALLAGLRMHGVRQRPDLEVTV